MKVYQIAPTIDVMVPSRNAQNQKPADDREEIFAAIYTRARARIAGSSRLEVPLRAVAKRQHRVAILIHHWRRMMIYFYLEAASGFSRSQTVIGLGSAFLADATGGSSSRPPPQVRLVCRTGAAGAQWFKKAIARNTVEVETASSNFIFGLLVTGLLLWMPARASRPLAQLAGQH